MEIKNSNNIGQIGYQDIQHVVVRKANNNDIDNILDVARSVGNANKVHTSGFLVDDYEKDYNYFQTKFLQLITELEHFYVLEGETVLGFLIAYRKEEWLRYNSKWLEDVKWNPEFNMENLKRFILIDKTAILSGLTGKGLGSLLYKTLMYDIQQMGISDIFAETIISPTPNFASLEFRIKQKYSLAGIRYEHYKNTMYTDLVYHKSV